MHNQITNVGDRRHEAATDLSRTSMLDFRLCVAIRDTDGMLGEPLHEEIITAPDARGAVMLAKAADLDMARLKANALYLVDQRGNVVWSLRIADVAADGP